MKPTDQLMEDNRKLWDELTPIHARSAFYDMDGFKNGRIALTSLEREELGDVTGKSMLHLQCHFGLDTLSWARLGAQVTGIDFSDASINLARALAEELAIPARFIRSNIYELPAVLDEQFDIVFTSYGVLSWLPELQPWAELIARYLKPAGTFYIIEEHPFAMVFDDAADRFRVERSYFRSGEPIRSDATDYAEQGAAPRPRYTWAHGLGAVITALAKAGLRIDHVHELPMAPWQALSFLEEGPDGWWVTKPGTPTMPMTFSLRATKP